MILTHLLTDLIDTALDNGDGAGEHGVQGEEDVVSLHGDDAHRELVVVLLLHSGKGLVMNCVIVSEI